MADKLTEQFTLKLSEVQFDALTLEANRLGVPACDLLRGYIDQLRVKQLREFRLMQQHYERHGNKVNDELQVELL